MGKTRSNSSETYGITILRMWNLATLFYKHKSTHFKHFDSQVIIISIAKVGFMIFQHICFHWRMEWRKIFSIENYITNCYNDKRGWNIQIYWWHISYSVHVSNNIHKTKFNPYSWYPIYKTIICSNIHTDETNTFFPYSHTSYIQVFDHPKYKIIINKIIDKRINCKFSIRKWTNPKLAPNSFNLCDAVNFLSSAKVHEFFHHS